MSRQPSFFVQDPDKPNLWTVMLYMAGDNNLDQFGISDLREIKRVGSSKQVQVIAELDRKGPDHGTKRYWLKNREVTPSLADDVLEELDESDSGSPEQLTKFIRWGIDNFPAQNYFVILWAHGAGAYDEDMFFSGDGRFRRESRHGLFRPFVPPETINTTLDTNRMLLDMRLIATDEQARSFIDNEELKRALQDVGQPIHILGMDACLMSMIEVCYQLKDSVGITLASEAQEPLEGWPYEAILTHLTKRPEMEPKAVAAVVVDEFVTLYKDYEDATTTLAACDLSLVSEATRYVAELTDVLVKNDQPAVFDAFMLARYIVQCDNTIESVDLVDLCELLVKKTPDESIRKKAQNLIEFLQKSGFIIKAQPLEGPTKFWHGVAIYFPQFEVSERYAKLDFVQPNVTKWKQFIDTYVSTSGR